MRAAAACWLRIWWRIISSALQFWLWCTFVIGFQPPCSISISEIKVFIWSFVDQIYEYCLPHIPQQPGNASGIDINKIWMLVSSLSDLKDLWNQNWRTLITINLVRNQAPTSQQLQTCQKLTQGPGQRKQFLFLLCNIFLIDQPPNNPHSHLRNSCKSKAMTLLIHAIRKDTIR